MERGLRSLPCCPLLSRSIPPLHRTPPPAILVNRAALQRSHIRFRVCSSLGSQESRLDTEVLRKDKFLADCGNDQECVVGGIVALGKFDALHIGHRELAIQASKAGVPFLLSFVGIAEVLGWPFRAPIVAKCDRERVLASWAPYCGNVVPLEFHIEFSNVRHLTPRQFVERLSTELRISGVVAGENYRFGYKASGDAAELVRLCNEYGLEAYIVNSVMDKTWRSHNGASKKINMGDKGQVSSSRVRYALAMGDMKYVEELLGRKHRLVLKMDQQCGATATTVSAPKLNILNQPPKDGVYNGSTLLLDNVPVGQCNVVINPESIDIELDGRSISAEDLIKSDQLTSLEFG